MRVCVYFANISAEQENSRNTSKSIVYITLVSSVYDPYAVTLLRQRPPKPPSLRSPTEFGFDPCVDRNVRGRDGGGKLVRLSIVRRRYAIFRYLSRIRLFGTRFANGPADIRRTERCRPHTCTCMRFNIIGTAPEIILDTILPNLID